MSEQDRLILKVLRLYYEQERTQAQIAERLGFSRPKVSKLIAEGKQKRLVNIEIAEPSGSHSSLEVKLENKFGLREALVASPREDEHSTAAAVGRLSAEFLGRACGPDSTIGISWGRSVRAVADALPRGELECRRVVPLVGGLGKATASLQANQISSILADKTGGSGYQLAAPALARSIQSCNELKEMPGIREALQAGANCAVAIVGVGSIQASATMVEAGYFTVEQFLEFGKRGAAGDVCCHFIDDYGRPCFEELSSQIVGISLEQLRDIPTTVGVAYGVDKASGTRAFLRGGYAESLICDRELAEALLQ